jgi:hypothetical protein
MGGPFPASKINVKTGEVAVLVGNYDRSIYVDEFGGWFRLPNDEWETKSKAQ